MLRVSVRSASTSELPTPLSGGGDVQSSQSLCQLQELRVLHQPGVLGYHPLYALGDGIACLCSHVAQGVLLLVAQQRDFFLVAYVASRGRQFGQVAGKGGFLLIACGLDFFLADEQLLVVGDGQCPATVQTEAGLCLCRQER